MMLFYTAGSEDSASSVTAISKKPAKGSSGYFSIASDTSGAITSRSIKSRVINATMQDTESGYSSVNEKKEPTFATMQKELFGHIAKSSNELQISRTKGGQAGQPVTAVSYQAASTGSTAQAGGGEV